MLEEPSIHSHTKIGSLAETASYLLPNLLFAYILITKQNLSILAEGTATHKKVYISISCLTFS